MSEGHLLLRIEYDKESRISKILQFVLFFLIYVAIRYAYPAFFPHYGNQSFTVKLEAVRIIIGIIGVICIWFTSKKEYKIYIQNNRISAAITFFLNFIYFLPGIYMCMIYDRQLDYAILFIVYTILFNIIMIAFARKEIKPFNHIFSERDTTIICVVLAVIMLVASLFLSGFKLNFLNVFNQSEVYQTRLENDMTVSHYIMWYFIIFGAAIIPTWLVIALRKKQYYIAILYTITVFAMYSVSCNRQFLFTLAFAYVAFFFRNNKRLLYLIFLGIWGLVQIEYLAGHGYLWSDILRRISLVPNVNAAFHVDFFMKNEPDFLRQALNMYANRLGFTSPYSEKIAVIIGRMYFGTTINANTGLLGGNFANYGILGVIIGPLLYAISFRILDKIFSNVQYRDVMLATAMVISIFVTNNESWLELIITPSWILFYYISLVFIPTNGIDFD